MTGLSFPRIRTPIPSGHVLGRASSGTGVVEAIPYTDLATKIISTGLVVPTGGQSAPQWTAGFVSAVDDATSNLVIVNGTLTSVINPANLSITSGTLGISVGPTIAVVQGVSPVIIQGNTAMPAVLNPALLMLIGKANGGSRLAIDCYPGSGGGVPDVAGRCARGTPGAPSASQSGDGLMAIHSYGYGTTGYSAGSRGSFSFFAAENWTDTAQGTNWSMLCTTPGGTVTGPSLTFDGHGTLAIPTATAATLNVNGTGNFSNLGTVAGGATLAVSSGTLGVTIPTDKWGPAAVTALGTTAGGGTLSISSGTLSVLGGWTEGAVTALGTVASGTTLTNSSGTLLPSGGWAGGAVTALGTGITLTSGTLTSAGGSSQWTAGTVTALASNQLAITSGTLGIIAGPTIAVTAGTAPMVLNANTAVPSTGVSPLLKLVGVDGANATFESDAFGTSSGVVWAVRQAAGTEASPLATASGTKLFNFQINGYNGTAYVSGGALNLTSDAAFGASNGGASWIFTNTSTTSASVQERMRIHSEGAVLIGTTAPTATELLNVAGTVVVNALNVGGTGAFATLGTTAGGGTLSIASGTLSVLGGWTEGAITALGTLAGGTTLANSSGTLTPSGGWSIGAATALGTLAGGTTLSLSSGTLTPSGGWSEGAASAFGGSMNLAAGTLSNVGRGTLTLVGTTTGTISTTAGFSTYLVNNGTANGTIAMGASTNTSSPIRLDILQGATAHLVAFDTTVIAGTDITGFTATTTAGLYDMVELIPATNGKWRIGAVAHGYAA